MPDAPVEGTRFAGYRARIAGAGLVLAPLFMLGAEVIPARVWPAGLLLLSWCAYATWIVAVLGIEHFLKRSSDRWAGLGNALGLLGSFTAANAVAARIVIHLIAGWDGHASPNGPALDADLVVQGLTYGASSVLGAGLFVLGLGYRRHRIAPAFVAVGLLGGGGFLVINGILESWLLAVVASVFLALALGAIGAALLRRPEAWIETRLSIDTAVP